MKKRGVKREFQFEEAPYTHSRERKKPRIDEKKTDRNTFSKGFDIEVSSISEKKVCFPVYVKVVRDRNEDLMKFKLKPTTRVGHIRKYLARKYKIHAHQIDLTCRQNIMLDNQNLTHCGIHAHMIIECKIFPDDDSEKASFSDTASFVSLGLQAMQTQNVLKFQLKHLHKDGKMYIYDLQLPKEVNGETLRSCVCKQLKIDQESVVIYCADFVPLCNETLISEQIQPGQEIHCISRSKLGRFKLSS